MTAHHLPGSPRCPHCGHVLDGAINTDDTTHPPAADDLTICAGCAAPLAFTSPTTLRLATEDDVKQLTTDQAVAIARIQRIVIQHMIDRKMS